MRFLLTNDDGIDALGLTVLQDALSGFGELYVVAPVGAQSGCSHATTTERPLQIEKLGAQRFALHGTPADCVRVGLHDLVPTPTWILSGVNHGGNLGADVYYSGTVAAVREGVLHGVPGLAFSHYRKRGLDFSWQRVGGFLRRILPELLSQPVEQGTFWNVNFPHLLESEPEPDLVFCPLDPHPLPLSFATKEEGYHYNGDYHARARIAGGDVEVCFSGKIAATKIRL